MRKGFSLFTPLVGVVIVIVSMLLSINMVSTEMSVAAVITNRLEREKCVLEGDLVAVGQENLYRSQSVNVFEGLLNQIRKNGIDIPSPDTSFSDFSRSDFVRKVMDIYLSDTEIRIQAGLVDLFQLGAGLYSGSVGECFIRSGSFEGIADAIEVDRGSVQNLVIIADQDEINRVTMNLNVEDGAGNSIRLPVNIYGGTYSSKYPIITFVGVASEAVHAVSSEVNKGYCSKKPGAPCEDTCELVFEAFEPRLYSQFTQEVTEQILVPTAKDVFSQIRDYNTTCSFEYATSLVTPKGVISSDALYANFILGVKKMTCEIFDNTTVIFKVTSGPMYYRHHDYISGERSYYGDVYEKLSCGIISSYSADSTAPEFTVNTDFGTSASLGTQLVFTVIENSNEEELSAYLAMQHNDFPARKVVDFRDDGNGKYTAIVPTLNDLVGKYTVTVTLEDDAGNIAEKELDLELVMGAPHDILVEATGSDNYRVSWEAPYGSVSGYWLYEVEDDILSPFPIDAFYNSPVDNIKAGDYALFAYDSKGSKGEGAFFSVP